MENLINKIKQWWKNQKINYALNEIERLENERSFISEFFCGETSYPIRLKKWEEDLARAKEKYNHLTIK